MFLAATVNKEVRRAEWSVVLWSDRKRATPCCCCCCCWWWWCWLWRWMMARLGWWSQLSLACDGRAPKWSASTLHYVTWSQTLSTTRSSAVAEKTSDADCYLDFATRKLSTKRLIHTTRHCLHIATNVIFLFVSYTLTSNHHEEN